MMEAPRIVVSAGVLTVSETITGFAEQYRYVCRVLARHRVHPADIEDLAQEVFLVMWRRRDQYQRGRSLRPWLAGIAVRVALKHLERRRRERRPRAAEPGGGAVPLPDDDLASARARRLALEALELLPARHRATIVAYALDGVPVKELAARWSVPLPTAYSRVRVAREALVAVLTELRSRESRIERRAVVEVSEGDGPTVGVDPCSPPALAGIQRGARAESSSPGSSLDGGGSHEPSYVRSHRRPLPSGAGR